jgi:hypothetical protein
VNLKKKHTWVMASNQIARGQNDSLTYALNTWEIIALSINDTPLPVRAAIILDYTHLSKQALSHD